MIFLITYVPIHNTKHNRVLITMMMMMMMMLMMMSGCKPDLMYAFVTVLGWNTDAALV